MNSLAHLRPIALLAALSISEMQNINDKQQLLQPNFIARCHKLRRRDVDSHTCPDCQIRVNPTATKKR